VTLALGGRIAAEDGQRVVEVGQRALGELALRYAGLVEPGVALGVKPGGDLGGEAPRRQADARRCGQMGLDRLGEVVGSGAGIRHLQTAQVEEGFRAPLTWNPPCCAAFVGS